MQVIAQKTLEDKLQQQAIYLYSPTEIYELEQNWFKTNDSFGLMQQAAWQMAHIIKNGCGNKIKVDEIKSVLIVAGSGNNGGDGWLVAHYLRQLCTNWSVQVLQLAEPSTTDSQKAEQSYENDISISQNSSGEQNQILDVQHFLKSRSDNNFSYHFDLIIDGIFGIGLDRQPTGDYQRIIEWINDYRKQVQTCKIISIDVPSGLNAATGEVYEKTAIYADFTLCLIARKIGLHLGDSRDYVGEIIDVPLIPVLCSDKYLHNHLPMLPKRHQVSHKGTYGHVLIIGGNRLDNGQGMAGAAILAASCAFAGGAGKVTVACHRDFHPSIITALPNAMTADLHQTETIIELIKSVDVVAIGMGLGRDKTSFELFKKYLDAIIQNEKLCVIDADGLYHLAAWEQINQNSLSENSNLFLGQNHQKFYLTPHSAEAGRLIDKSYAEVDSDKISAIYTLSEKFGGNWLIKGAETIVFERYYIGMCGLGNAGMATAGMGDCLAGLIAAMLSQNIANPMLTSVLIHAKAGDELAKQVGEYALQANQMALGIGKVILQITEK